ncbi:golgin subfamily A member 6-like protein 22 [Epinephelus fuscoguttatus]|uniref:golgin subfamily A member 6-like protein 22 n=1 Tax=Epinephelus fuscoguttatus TaxID=293821 RepID=UPI0020D0DE25|nr:golgin subfamily A member 6-like protein 22 [Epinephelus fuscoguttatus]
MEILQPLRGLYNLLDRVKKNNQQCPHVEQRLRALEKLMLFILKKEQEELSDDVIKALGKLNEVILSAAELIRKFTGSFKLTQAVKSNDYKLEFDNLNKSLTDAFVTLSAALHVHQGKRLDEQENMLQEQRKMLAEQERKLAEQERKLQRVESKLAYECRAYYCVLQ